MHPKDDWNAIPRDRTWPLLGAGIGAVRAALLFGAVAVAFALMMVPIVDKRSRDWARTDTPRLDSFKTGTVSARETYTVRRSVLQASPTSVCTISSNGERSGDC